MKRAQTRSAEIGPDARPVAIPPDIGTSGAAKAGGVVALPLGVRRSHRITYNLADEADRRMVYEQVLAEGTDDDVSRFIDVDELQSMWDELVLPPRVRRAWAAWFRQHRGATLSC